MEKIKNKDELEFAIFCIENVAAYLGVSPRYVYDSITKQSNILNNYILDRSGATSLNQNANRTVVHGKNYASAFDSLYRYLDRYAGVCDRPDR